MILASSLRSERSVLKHLEHFNPDALAKKQTFDYLRILLILTLNMCVSVLTPNVFLDRSGVQGYRSVPV